MQEISNNDKPAGFFSDLPSKAALGLLRAYKWAISPMFPPSCRYTPTCSEYAAEAIARYGVLRGSLLAAWRVLRCHPFVRGGFDPVPNRTPVDADADCGAALHQTGEGARLHISPCSSPTTLSHA